MPVQLGEAFRAPEPVALPTGDERRHQELLAELAAVRDVLTFLAAQPAPVVHVDPPDLSGLQALLGQPAVAPPALDLAPFADAVTRALENAEHQHHERHDALITQVQKLAKKITNVAGAPSAGISGVVATNERQPLHTVDVHLDTRYEWQEVAGASVPLYSATAAPGTPTDNASWRVEKYTYATGPAGDAVPTVIQTATGAWDSRATLF